jgi:hypothetical protein
MQRCSISKFVPNNAKGGRGRLSIRCGQAQLFGCAGWVGVDCCPSALVPIFALSAGQANAEIDTAETSIANSMARLLLIMICSCRVRGSFNLVRKCAPRKPGAIAARTRLGAKTAEPRTEAGPAAVIVLSDKGLDAVALVAGTPLAARFATGRGFRPVPRLTLAHAGHVDSVWPTWFESRETGARITQVAGNRPEQRMPGLWLQPESAVVILAAACFAADGQRRHGGDPQGEGYASPDRRANRRDLASDRPSKRAPWRAGARRPFSRALSNGCSLFVAMPVMS